MGRRAGVRLDGAAAERLLAAAPSRAARAARAAAAAGPVAILAASVAVLASLAALGQSMPYGDGPLLLERVRAGKWLHDLHPLGLAWLALGWRAAEAVGLHPYGGARLAGALGVAAGVAFLGAALRALGGSTGRVLAAMALAATLPAMLFHGTIVELHGGFVGAAGLVLFGTARLVRAVERRGGALRWALLTGLAGGLATAVHATGVLLPFAALAFARIARQEARSRPREGPRVEVREEAREEARDNEREQERENEREQERENGREQERQEARARARVRAEAAGGERARDERAVPRAWLGPAALALLVHAAAAAAGLVALRSGTAAGPTGYVAAAARFAARDPGDVLASCVREWLVAYAPLAWVAAAGLVVGRGRRDALWLHAALLPYLALVGAMLGHVHERGAYLLPMGLVAAAWGARRLPPWVVVLIASAGAAFGSARVLRHDARARATQPALAAAATGDALVLTAHLLDVGDALAHDPPLDTIPIWRIVEIPPAKLDVAVEAICRHLDERLAAGAPVLIGGRSLAVLRHGDAVADHYPGPARLRAALDERYVAARVEGGHLFRLTPRPSRPGRPGGTER